LQDTLDGQEIHNKPGFGITEKVVKKSKSNPKFGAGQGIGWSGQACNATLNIISNVMTNSCKGMEFVSPSKEILVLTFGDYFVDDLEVGTNMRGKHERKRKILKVDRTSKIKWPKVFPLLVCQWRTK